MHLRMARFLAILAVLTLSCEVCAQLSPPGSAEPFVQIETDGAFQDGPFSIDAVPGGGLILALSLYGIIAFLLFLITSSWIVFAKADQPGWACLLPIYNIIVLLQIAGKPWWWFFLYMIPVLGLIVVILHMVALAESFGKGAGYGIGLFFLPFLFVPLLAFGDAEYSGGDWAGL